jgi:hypothetical protein
VFVGVGGSTHPHWVASELTERVPPHAFNTSLQVKHPLTKACCVHPVSGHGGRGGQ